MHRRTRKISFQSLLTPITGILGVFLLAAHFGVWAAHVKKAPVSELEVQGLLFREGGQPFFLDGVEAPGLYRLTQDQLAAFFQKVKTAGGKVVKTNAFSTGQTQDALQTGADQWDEKSLAKLDQMTTEAKKAGVKLVLSLCSANGNEGGTDAYASWVGSPNPGVFYINYQCKDWYRHYVKMLLSRVNTITGTSYKSDPTILAWDLMDSPSNPNGEPEAINQWVAEMASYLKTLSPQALVCLTLDPNALGLNMNTAAGQAGVEFVFERIFPNASSPQKWALRLGKPVVALLEKPQAQSQELGAGVLVAQGISGLDQWKGITSLFTNLTQEGGFGAKDLFESVSAVPESAPALCWEAKGNIKVVLTEPAKVVVRYGTGGVLDHETTPSLEAAVLQHISLENLLTGKEYSFQVKAIRDKDTQYSNISTFSTPKVKALTVSASKMSKNFIMVEGDHFYVGKKIFRFVGTNNYQLHIAEPDKLEYVMNWAEKLGFQVMRTWAFGESKKPEKDWADWEKRRYFVTAPGQFREEAFKDLDSVVVSAAKHNIRLVLALANNWGDYGGAPEWVKFFGSTEKNDFFDKKEIKEAFKAYIKAMVTHVNTLTGVAYKDDPTIMAWDLMNEPRYERDTTGKTLVAWIDEMSSYLKSLGIKQLVTTGSEGFKAENGTHYSGVNFILDHQPKSIDYAVFHVYPTGDYSMWNLETTEAVLTSYVKDAHEVLKKPVVLEEFGIDKGKPGYDRPSFIYNMMKIFYDAGGDGTQYWMLAEPTYNGDGNQIDPTMTDICNTFVIESNELRGGK